MIWVCSSLVVGPSLGSLLMIPRIRLRIVYGRVRCVVLTRIVLRRVRWLVHVVNRCSHVKMHFGSVHVVVLVWTNVRVAFVVDLFLFLFVRVDRVHTVLFVSLAFVVLLIFVGQLFPCVPDEPCHRTTFRWHSGLGLF